MKDTKQEDPVWAIVPRQCYSLLEIAADPKHLGAQISFLSVLHTWGQNLLHHPHVHCVIPSGGLSPDHKAWVRPRYRFFLPVKVLSRVFRGKFIAGLKRAYRNNELCLPGDLQPLAQDKAIRSFLRSLFRRLVCLCQASLRRTAACFPLPRPLHTSGRYIQPPADCFHRRQSNVPLEGLCTRQQTTSDDPHGRGVPAAVSATHTSTRSRPNPFLRFPRLPKRGALLPLCQQRLEANAASGSYSSAPTKACPPDTWTCPHRGGPKMLIERLTAQQIQQECETQGDYFDAS